MHRIGFSTGALAYGNFQLGIELQRRPGIDAIELSALRESELPALLVTLPALNLTQFDFQSFHAPSALERLSSSEVARMLHPVAAAGIPIVVHPDIINDEFSAWRMLGDSVLLENMDGRKTICRTAQEMAPFFEALPAARFCFDIGHARQVDPTMSVAVELLLNFRSRLAEVHISEVNWQCKHLTINAVAELAYKRVATLIPDSIPVIIESVVAPEHIEHELDTVRRCLDTSALASTLPLQIGEASNLTDVMSHRI